MKKITSRLLTILLILGFSAPTIVLAKDAECIAFGFKSDAAYKAKMNSEAKSMKSLLPALMGVEFGDIKTCMQSNVENTFFIEDGKNQFTQKLGTGITEYHLNGRLTKCFNSNSFRVYQPVGGKCL